VYSSGSIHAQKLFFAHSEAGDMTPLFSGYFDTTSGAKQDMASYQRIVSAIGLRPANVLFLSDIVAELDAARQAGLQTCWLVRPADVVADDATIAASQHPVARDFSGVCIKP
jgi:enolase-phosphatase E1